VEIYWGAWWEWWNEGMEDEKEQMKFKANELKFLIAKIRPEKIYSNRMH